MHHYFTDKADLFAAAIKAPIRPDRIVRAALDGPRDRVGENLVRLALTALDGDVARATVLGLMRTALGHDFAAGMLRQFLVSEVFHRIAKELGDHEGGSDGKLRATLAASQIAGLIVVRYGIRADPLASADIDELVARVGPVVQWHLLGYPSDETVRSSGPA